MSTQFTTIDTDNSALELLAWYDAHHRSLPWRVSPGERAQGRTPDPYRVWLSEVMLQQTTVPAVTGYFELFLRSWPTVHDLANASNDKVMGAWAGLGYYARARNLHKCAGIVSREMGGVFPDTEPALLKLPGIGPYTAAAIAAIAFDRPTTVVDGNVERVVARFFAITDPLPGSKPTLKSRAALLTPICRPGDYAQAMMDLGATVCTPRNPACGVCPLMAGCAGRQAGLESSLPRKTPKKAKPIRYGIAYVAIDPGGQVLTVRRPEKGLLGGMLALPTTRWLSDAKQEDAPVEAKWREIGEVRHTFTHFHLILRVQMARLDRQLADAVPLDELFDVTPTVFAKVCRLAANESGLKLNNEKRGARRTPRERT